MIYFFDIGFAKLYINLLDGTGNALFGDNRMMPVTNFEYARRGMGDRTNSSVRFELVQTIPTLHRSPFKATIEAELLKDFFPLPLLPEKVQPSPRDTYVSLSGRDRPRSFHEGVWDGFHCAADEGRSESDPEYKAGVEEGFARYQCDAPI